MTDQDAIEVVAKWGGEENGIPYAILEYYMEKNPRQTEWRRVPGFITGTSQEDTMEKAQAIARELSDLNIQELQPALRKLYESQRMIRLLKTA